eukprot:6195757-Pleurochrysis_carterae.AAC.3
MAAIMYGAWSTAKTFAHNAVFSPSSAASSRFPRWPHALPRARAANKHALKQRAAAQARRAGRGLVSKTQRDDHWGAGRDELGARDEQRAGMTSSAQA